MRYWKSFILLEIIYIVGIVSSQCMIIVSETLGCFVFLDIYEMPSFVDNYEMLRFL